MSMLPYYTCDVATEPPTNIVIIPAGTNPPPMASDDGVWYALTDDCVEETEGWLSREGKPSLTICFMHSFGKCSGRTGNRHSCFQIHIKPSVLNALRSYYDKSIRKYFTRTVKAWLPEEVRNYLCDITKKKVKVQYLEYRVQDALPTSGLLVYEAAYRKWLFATDNDGTDVFQYTQQQCKDYAMLGTCELGSECPHIHANIKTAQMRDPVLSKALRDFNAPNEELSPTRGGPRPAGPSTDAASRGQPPLGVTSVPAYVLQDCGPGAKLVPLKCVGGTNLVTVPQQPCPPPSASQTKPTAAGGDAWQSSSNEGVSSNTKSGSSGSGSD